MSSSAQVSAQTRRRLSWFHRPRFCFYYVTDLCDARCHYCHFGNTKANDGRRHFVEVNEVKQNLTSLHDMGVRFVDFTGGEPLLHPKIMLLLEMAKSLGFLTGLTTNGTLYQRYADTLRSVVDYLEFSLDAADSQLHQRLREGTRFERVLENLELARSLGVRPTVNMTVSHDNVSEIPSVYRLTRRFGVQLILNPQFHAIRGENADKETLDQIAQFGWRPFIYVNHGLLSLYRSGGNRRTAPRCCAMTAAVAIGPDNTLRGPCYHRAVHSLPIGDDLAAIRYSAEAKWLESQQGRLPSCEGCRISCYLELSLFYQPDRLWLLNALSLAKFELERGSYALWDAFVQRRSRVVAALQRKASGLWDR
jgi:pyruvate-formate lyase-activating enzyme